MRPDARSEAGVPWLRLLVGLGITTAIAAAYLALPQKPPPVEVSPAPMRPAEASMPPAWTPVERPLPVYGLDAAGLRSQPFAFAARRNAAGEREDTLTFGGFDGDEAHLRLILQRSLHPERPDRSFFLDLARRASGAGLAVLRSSPSEGLATKFGFMETSEATLSDASERACFAFRFSHEDVGFRLVGWHCPARGQALDRTGLACTLDRLSLAEAGSDDALKLVFAQADRQRAEGCAPAPMVASAEPRRRDGRAASRPTRHARPAVTAAQKGSASLRATGRGAGSASPNNRG